MRAGAGRRPHRPRAREERGSVTAELALLLPAVVVVLLVCLTLGAAVLGQVRCADAARAAARAAAIGEPAAVVAAVARELAGPEADVTVAEDGGWVEVRVSRQVASDVPGLSGLRAAAVARAWVEPGTGR
ncbi:pilus assembly protein TadE [Georgenia sp. 311]|nr:pilus assembly protein TadE [Georgenia sp. 311]